MSFLYFPFNHACSIPSLAQPDDPRGKMLPALGRKASDNIAFLEFLHIEPWLYESEALDLRRRSSGSSIPTPLSMSPK